MTKRKMPEDDMQEPTSSQGEDSKSVTPKDVGSSTASAKDVKERKVASDDPEERIEEQLDDAVEMTFPASDPIAIPDPDKAERHHPRP
ncbi:MAG TPA: hypothetical protein VM406_16115 [Noviherbaspirillum sp.]|nr:hypothetical protein [Noviherbaspirillum sp.]